MLILSLISCAVAFRIVCSSSFCLFVLCALHIRILVFQACALFLLAASPCLRPRLVALVCFFSSSNLVCRLELCFFDSLVVLSFRLECITHPNLGLHSGVLSLFAAGSSNTSQTTPSKTTHKKDKKKATPSTVEHHSDIEMDTSVYSYFQTYTESRN